MPYIYFRDTTLEVAEQTHSTFDCLTHWLDRRRRARVQLLDFP